MTCVPFSKKYEVQIQKDKKLQVIYRSTAILLCKTS